MNWNSILNWRLLHGPHKFPGPDGGTCINEAAIVAAGFEYRSVFRITDCPPCFSRVIAAYALRLNDSMQDALRQELLMPFVVRLAGTADRPEIEARRAAHMAVQTITRILPIVLRASGLEEEALRCEAVDDLTAAAPAARAAYAAARMDCTLHAPSAAVRADRATYAATRLANLAAYAATCFTLCPANDGTGLVVHASPDAAEAIVRVADEAGFTAAWAGAEAADVAGDAAAAEAGTRKQIFTIAVAILDEAIKRGKQAEPIEAAIVMSRMAQIKARAPCLIE